MCTYLLNVMTCIYPGCWSLVSYVQEFMWGGEREGRRGEELPPVCWSLGCRHHCTAHRAQSASRNTSTSRETGEEHIGKVITCTQHTK